jgi:hypothetical protein
MPTGTGHHGALFPAELACRYAFGLSDIGRCRIRFGDRVGGATASTNARVEIDKSALLASMGTLALNSRILKQRVIYPCFLYGAFSVFWTTIPLRLMGPAFHFSRAGVALFALWAVAFWRRRPRALATEDGPAWPPPAR